MSVDVKPMQKRMAFRSSVILFPPMRLEPGSCQAVRIAAILDKPVNRVEVTPEWRAEQEVKQKKYEQDRQEHYARVGRHQSETL
jgi:hypothetical protein